MGSYPFDPQTHSVVGGTSYSTDMTNVVGSWDDKESHNESPIVLVILESSCNKDKGIEGGR